MKMIPARAIVSVFRTAVYGTVAGFFAITESQAATVVNSVLIGGFTADFLTWLIRSIFLLPNHLVLGAYDAAIYLLIGVLLFRVEDIDVGTNSEAICITFLTFMLVAGLKVAYYAAEIAMDSQADDT